MVIDDNVRCCEKRKSNTLSLVEWLINTLALMEFMNCSTEVGFFDVNYAITFFLYINVVLVEGINMLWAVLFV